jgi:hypothetical protein
MKKAMLMSLGSLALFALPLFGGGPTGQLEQQLATEARLLDNEIERFEQARDLEEVAVQRYLEMAAALDREMRLRRVSLDDIRRMAAELGRERESLISALRDAAHARETALDRGERILAIYGELNRARDARGRTGSIEGLWQVEIETLGEYGVVDLVLDGSLVTGRYHLENGSEGSLRGTFAGDALRLESIHSARGLDYTLEGKVNLERGEIRGRYQAVVLSQKGRAAGKWSARKVDR